MNSNIMDSIKSNSNPDCAKFCPFTECCDLLLIGFYHLEESKDTSGGFSLYSTK